MFFETTFHFDNKTTKNRFINILLISSQLEIRYAIANILITSNNTNSLALLANGSVFKRQPLQDNLLVIRQKKPADCYDRQVRGRR